MHLTLESLIQHANQLQQQFEAASNMMHQTAGALTFVTNQINLLKKAKAENEQSMEEGK